MKRRRVLLAGLAAVVLLGALGTGRYFLRRQGTAVPVLMYHHFVEQGPAQADTVVSAAVFEDQLRALKEGGYTSITPEQLLRYEDGEEELPGLALALALRSYADRLACQRILELLRERRPQPEKNRK